MPVEGDVAFSFWPAKIKSEATTGWLVYGTNFSIVEAVVADDGQSGTG